MPIEGRWGRRTLVALVAVGGLYVAACGSTGATPVSTSPAPSVRPATRSAPVTCPRRLNDLRDENRLARTELVPPAPRSMLVCRYVEQIGPGDGGARTVIAKRLVRSRGEVSSLRATLNGLSPIPRGSRSCPEPTTILRYLVDVAYEHEPPVYVRVNFAGCSSVSNGVDSTYYFPSRSLRRELAGAFA